MIVARAHLLAGDVAGARRVAEESLAFVAETGERIYEPEFHRVLAEYLLADSSRPADRTEAIARLERAIALAEEHGCLLFALRSATGLCREAVVARARASPTSCSASTAATTAATCSGRARCSRRAAERDAEAPPRSRLRRWPDLTWP